MGSNRHALALVLCFSALPALALTKVLDTDADFTFEGTQVTRTYGRHITAAGDVNGDGLDDLVVGNATAASGLGRVFGFRGRTNW